MLASVPSLSFVPKQLQHFLTSMTSRERCSIRRGCERDKAGTSLSSLVHKGRMACDRTSAPTERHLLLFAFNGCSPCTYTLPFSILALFILAFCLSFCKSQTVKGFCLSSPPPKYSEIKFVVWQQYSWVHISHKSKVSLMSTYVNPLLYPSFFKGSLQMCAQPSSSPESYCSTPQSISGQVSRAEWALACGPLSQGFRAPTAPQRE